MKWIKVSNELPPKGLVVETKIDDENGVRNVADLQYREPLWFMPDGWMYVYYVPTHWRYKNSNGSNRTD
jgi:hypothetical protein